MDSVSNYYVESLATSLTLRLSKVETSVCSFLEPVSNLDYFVEPTPDTETTEKVGEQGPQTI